VDAGLETQSRSNRSQQARQEHSGIEKPVCSHRGDSDIATKTSIPAVSTPLPTHCPAQPGGIRWHSDGTQNGMPRLKPAEQSHTDKNEKNSYDVVTEPKIEPKEAREAIFTMEVLYQLSYLGGTAWT
jgi:hypothetical protein